MAYFEKEELRQAKQMSAIEFLKRYRAKELVRCGTGEYELRSHDSFKISESTSLWHWKSRDIGGKSALDYLVRVEGVPFPVSWTVKMKKKQKETQDILSYHSQAAGCSDKARAKASGGRQPIEECGRTGL